MSDIDSLEVTVSHEEDAGLARRIHSIARELQCAIDDASRAGLSVEVNVSEWHTTVIGEGVSRLTSKVMVNVARPL